MTNLDLDEQLLVQHLHARMGDIHADLDRTTRVAAQAGLRMRRRRRTASTLAAVACVSFAGAAVTSLAATNRSTPNPGVDVRPAASATPTSPCAEGIPNAAEAGRSGLRVTCLPLTPGDEQALQLHLTGWHCQPAIEQRMECSNGARVAVVVWRRLPTYATPAHGGRPPTPMLVGDSSEHPEGSVVGRMGDRFFYAVEPGPGLSDRDLYAVTNAIRPVAGR